MAFFGLMLVEDLVSRPKQQPRVCLGFNRQINNSCNNFRNKQTRQNEKEPKNRLMACGDANRLFPIKAP